MFKNKRGFLLAEETLKMVIALIAISFLVYFLISLYMTNKTSKDLELAKATLEHLVEEINSLKDGEVRDVEVYNPEDLWISSWPYEKSMPLSCSNLEWKNCICICENPNLWEKAKSVVTSVTYIEKIAQECSSEWICREVSKKTIVGIGGSQTPLKIVDVPMKLNIEYSEGNIQITK